MDELILPCDLLPPGDELAFQRGGEVEPEARELWRRVGGRRVGRRRVGGVPALLGTGLRLFVATLLPVILARPLLPRILARVFGPILPRVGVGLALALAHVLGPVLLRVRHEIAARLLLPVVPSAVPTLEVDLVPRLAGRTRRGLHVHDLALVPHPLVPRQNHLVHVVQTHRGCPASHGPRATKFESQPGS